MDCIYYLIINICLLTGLFRLKSLQQCTRWVQQPCARMCVVVVVICCRLPIYERLLKFILNMIWRQGDWTNLHFIVFVIYVHVCICILHGIAYCDMGGELADSIFEGFCRFGGSRGLPHKVVTIICYRLCVYI